MSELIQKYSLQDFSENLLQMFFPSLSGMQVPVESPTKIPTKTPPRSKDYCQ